MIGQFAGNLLINPPRLGEISLLVESSRLLELALQLSSARYLMMAEGNWLHLVILSIKLGRKGRVPPRRAGAAIGDDKS
jgi:hypothetical protein